jgi:hypothetical protein
MGEIGTDLTYRGRYGIINMGVDRRNLLGEFNMGEIGRI